MITKAKLIEHIEQFPEEFSIDDLVAKLILIEKLGKGNEQSLKGEVISEQELEKEIDTWFK
ncbi:hypothetical protein [Polaribacter sp. L3A8]|uniref:hypothetical protein n=1 Tax=Polaribacter sp. L3A8 TaxID=2686361 RepID=UPI00131E4F8C|nr:hypothetical protein [Polaribacter sp. L3A8]